MMRSVKKKMSRRLVPRRAPDPAEFLSGTTPRLSMICCSTSSRKGSSETGGQKSDRQRWELLYCKDVQPKKAKAIASAVEKKVVEKMKGD